MIDLAAYGGLFLAALVAATILPMQSEAALIGLIVTERYSTIVHIAVASVGKVFGSVVNGSSADGSNVSSTAGGSLSVLPRWSAVSDGTAVMASGPCLRAG